jgi:site-specific recombinase XerD
MNDLVLANRAAEWGRLKSLVLDSVSSPITKRVYNLGLYEFIAWYGQEPRPGFTKATVAAWRVALEARGLGAVSINVRITAVRKLAVEAADNGLLAPELANGITRVKGVASKGVRLGNWLTAKQAQALLNAPDASTNKGLRDRAILAVLLGCGLRRSEVAALTVQARAAAGWPMVHRGSGWEAWPSPHRAGAHVDEGGHRCLDYCRRRRRWARLPCRESQWPSTDGCAQRKGRLAASPALC